MEFTQEELEKLLKKWQKTLRLTDWNIQVKIARANEMTREGVQGENMYSVPLHSSFIKIVDPVDWETDFCEEQDMEKTLVHELMHLVLCHSEPNPNKTLKLQLFEVSVEKLANAFVDMKRGQKK